MIEWQQTEFGKIPKSWEYKPLEEYFELITYGFTNPMPTVDKGPFMLTAKDIFNGRIQYETARRTSIEAYEKLLTEKSRPRINDILITKDGSIGRVAIVDQTEICISQSVALIRPKHNIEPLFLKYLLESPQYQKLIDIDATGSTIQHIYITKINKMLIGVPEISIQRKIVNCIHHLQSKIDLLHRQNTTLEKMAETLFRQWFVHRPELAEGEVNKEEWEEIELGSVVETTSGGTPSRNNLGYYENGIIPWVKSKELNGSFILETEEMITEEALKKSSAKILPKNSVLIAMYGATVGEYAIISKEMSCNQAVCALKPNSNYPYSYLFLLIKHNKNELINMAVGSAQQNISQLLIKQLPVLSCIEKINKFNSIVEPYFEKIKSNQTQIRTLIALRDTLLPKLMSGEVKVEI